MMTIDFCIFEGIASILFCTTLICYFIKDSSDIKENANQNINLLSIKDNSYNLLQNEKLKLLHIKKEPQMQTYILVKNNL